MNNKMQIKFAIPIVTILSGVSLLLQVIGFVTPGWTRVETEFNTYTGGLWYVIKCTPGHCETTSVNDLENMAQSVRYILGHDIVGLQTEATVSLVLTLLASVTILFFRKFPQHHVTLIFVIVILIVCHVISGGVALAACGTKARSLIEMKTLYDFGVPYSTIMTGLGAILNVVSAILLIIHSTHVVNTLKKQSSSTPFYVRSQMHQPLTKRDSGSKNQDRPKRPKVSGDNSMASSLDNTAFENEDADQYSCSPNVLRPPVNRSMEYHNQDGYEYQKHPRSMEYELGPENIDNITNDETARSRKRKIPSYTSPYENNPVSDIDYSYEIKGKDGHYEPYDEPRRRSPRKKRHDRSDVSTSTPTENQDAAMSRDELPYSQSKPLNKLRVKNPRLGRSSPATTPVEGRGENVNDDQRLANVRPPSYYEALELESTPQSYSMYGGAEISPVESSV